MSLLKASSQSSPNAVAGAIASMIRDQGLAEIQVIGAGALNQAVKAVAIARGFLVSDGIDLVCVPSFTEVLIKGEVRTAIRLAVHDRRATLPAGEASLTVAGPEADAEIRARDTRAEARPEATPGTGRA